MKYLLVFFFLAACAGPKPEPELDFEVPPPTIEEVDKTFEQIEKPKQKLPKKLPKKKVKRDSRNKK